MKSYEIRRLTCGWPWGCGRGAARSAAHGPAWWWKKAITEDWSEIWWLYGMYVILMWFNCIFPFDATPFFWKMLNSCGLKRWNDSGDSQIHRWSTLGWHPHLPPAAEHWEHWERWDGCYGRHHRLNLGRIRWSLQSLSTRPPDSWILLGVTTLEAKPQTSRSLALINTLSDKYYALCNHCKCQPYNYHILV